MPVFDDKGHILTPAEMWELSRTENGRGKLKVYILRARVAYAAQDIMEYLGVAPSAEKQQELCERLWERIFHTPIDEVMEYVKQVGETMNEEEEIIGHA